MSSEHQSPLGVGGANALANVLGEARILVETARDLRRKLSEPALAEFVEFVGERELAADLNSLERIAQSLDGDVDRYFAASRDAATDRDEGDE